MIRENPKLEDKQAELFNQVVEEYFFEVEVGGLKSQCSPILEAIKPDIELHFYRYGLFPERCKDQSKDNPPLLFNANGEQVEKLQEVKPANAPEVEGFFYGRTWLNSGYLYLFDARDEDLWYEFQVDATGGYLPVLWSENKKDGYYTNKRTAKGKWRDSLIFSQGTELWVAYSPVQWSVDYLSALRKSEERQNKRMQKVLCTGFKCDDKDQGSDILPFDYMEAAFWDHEKGPKHWFNSRIQRGKSGFELDQNNDNSAIKEDMHISLHDPVGCALDINQELGETNLAFKALVESIQSGQPVSYIKEKLRNLDFEIPVVNSDHYYLFTLAQMCHQMVYSNRAKTEQFDGGKPGVNFGDTHFPRELAAQEAADRRLKAQRIENRRYSDGYGTGYANVGRAMQESMTRSNNRISQEILIGYGLDRQKVEGLLGLEDRKDLAAQIEELRTALGQFLQSKYLKSLPDDYLHNTEPLKLEGDSLLSTILSNLFVAPGDMDRHLRLPQQQKVEDNWQHWILALLDPDCKRTDVAQTGIKSQAPDYEQMDPLHALASGGQKLEKGMESEMNIAAKLAIVTDASLGFLSKQIFDTKLSGGKTYRTVQEIKTFFVNRLSNRKFDGRPVFVLRRDEIFVQLNAFGYDLDPTYVKVAPDLGNKNKLRIYSDSEKVHIHTEGMVNYIDLPVHGEEELTKGQLKLQKLNHKAERVLNSTSFNRVVAGLQTVNLMVTLGGLTKAESESEKYKYSLAFLGVATDLTEAVINLQKARIKPIVGKGITVDVLTKRANLFGAIGGFITAGICIWDAVDAFKERDVDAGIAWAGAGVAFGVATAMTKVFTGVAFAGPIGAVAAGVGFGLVILAMHLSDSELEHYFKHFLLSDRVAFPKKANECPATYAARIIANRQRLMGKSAKEDNLSALMNPYDALASYLDLIVCPYMTFIPGAKLPEEPIIALRRCTIKMEFYQVFKFPGEQMDWQVYLYPLGMRKGNALKLRPGLDYSVFSNQGEQHILYASIDLSEEAVEYLTELSELLFMIRLENDLNTNLPFPYDRQDEQRYLAAYTHLGWGSTQFLFSKTKNVKVDYRDKLLNFKNW